MKHKRNFSDDHIETSLINVTRSNMVDAYTLLELAVSEDEPKDIRKQINNGERE